MTKQVVYVGSEAEFGWFGSHIGHFISNAAHVAGREIGHAEHGIVSAAGKVGHAIGKIPIVGGPLHTIMSAAYNFSMAPLNNEVDAAIHGRSLSKAMLQTLHDEVKSVKDVAPYAQMVMTMVPGVGQGIGAALGAAQALASGQRIDKILEAGALSAMPGGPMAKAAASAAAEGVKAAATGQKLSLGHISGQLLDNLPIPAVAKTALMSGTEVAGSIAGGKSLTSAVTDATLKKALATLPPDVQKAYHSGLAIGTATVLQAKRAAELVSAPVLNKLTESGIQASKAVPAIAEARKLAGAGTKGFDLAQGILGQRSKTFDILHLRETLKTPADQKGFDMALATKIGLVTQPARGTLSPGAQAGRAIAQGIQGMPHPGNQASILGTLHANASASVGAKLAANQSAMAKEPWYIKLMHSLGFSLGHKHVTA
jgi:hypothetical protein